MSEFQWSFLKTLAHLPDKEPNHLDGIKCQIQEDLFQLYDKKITASRVFTPKEFKTFEKVAIYDCIEPDEPLLEGLSSETLLAIRSDARFNILKDQLTAGEEIINAKTMKGLDQALSRYQETMGQYAPLIGAITPETIEQVLVSGLTAEIKAVREALRQAETSELRARFKPN